MEYRLENFVPEHVTKLATDIVTGWNENENFDPVKVTKPELPTVIVNKKDVRDIDDEVILFGATLAAKLDAGLALTYQNRDRIDFSAEKVKEFLADKDEMQNAASIVSTKWNRSNSSAYLFEHHDGL